MCKPDPYGQCALIGPERFRGKYSLLIGLEQNWELSRQGFFQLCCSFCHLRTFPEHFVAVFVAVFVLRVRLVRLSGGCSVLRTDPEGNQSVRTKDQTERNPVS